MGIYDIIVSPYLYVRLFWTISLFLIVLMTRSRIKPHLKTEWDVMFEYSWPFRRNILNTFVKMYTTIENTDSLKLAELARNEICMNSAIAFNKSPTYFIKYRTDYKKMNEYFKDDELIKFIANPKVWAMQNGGIRYLFFGLIKENTITLSYLQQLSKLLDRFTLNIYVT